MTDSKIWTICEPEYEPGTPYGCSSQPLMKILSYSEYQASLKTCSPTDQRRRYRRRGIQCLNELLRPTFTA